MEPSTSQKSTLTDRPLQEVIEEAAKEAADEVRDRNKRMGWPLVVSEPSDVPKNSLITTSENP